MKIDRIRYCHLFLVLLAPGLSSAFSMVHQGETQQVNMFTPPQKFNFFNLMILQALVGKEFDVLCQTDSFYEFCIFVSPIGQRCEFEWRRKVRSCFFVFSVQCNYLHPFCRSGISAAAIALSWNCVQVSWERTTSTNVGSGSGMPGQVTPGYGDVRWSPTSLVEAGALGLLCEEELRYVASLLGPHNALTIKEH